MSYCSGLSAIRRGGGQQTTLQGAEAYGEGGTESSDMHIEGRRRKLGHGRRDGRNILDDCRIWENLVPPRTGYGGSSLTDWKLQNWVAGKALIRAGWNAGILTVGTVFFLYFFAPIRMIEVVVWVCSFLSACREDRPNDPLMRFCAQFCEKYPSATVVISEFPRLLRQDLPRKRWKPEVLETNQRSPISQKRHRPGKDVDWWR